MSLSDNELLDQLAKSKETTSSEYLVYGANGLFVTLVPTYYLYISIFGLSFVSYAPVFVLVSLLSGVLLAISYQNVADSIKQKLLGQLPEPVLPKNTKKEDRAAARAAINKQHQAVAVKEAMSFSLVYNNLFYLSFLVFLGFFVFKNLAPLYNFTLSVSASAALAMLSSTSK
eukprot:TRINITY_DN9171_c0_g1_i1.p1 TRINITY_DN9171_c0_g1~~TRINITY_DN9171_c0_g1_i1.p1  ORF type:complete len:188 (+),score=58.63 TRINITY_DN9171_c0_g1_i1:49-564(+)